MSAPPTDLVARAQAIVDAYGAGATFAVEGDIPMWGRPWTVHWWGGLNERCGVLCTLLDEDAGRRALAVLRAGGFVIGVPATALGANRGRPPSAAPE